MLATAKDLPPETYHPGVTIDGRCRQSVQGLPSLETRGLRKVLAVVLRSVIYGAVQYRPSHKETEIQVQPDILIVYGWCIWKLNYLDFI